MGVESDEVDGRRRRRPLDRPSSVADAHAEPELRVVLAGLHVLMRVGLDARCHPQQHGRRDAVIRMKCVQAVELVERVDDEATDPRGARHPELFDALVVAVQDETVGGEAGRERDVKLSPGRDVEPEVLLVDQPRHGAAQKRL